MNNPEFRRNLWLEFSPHRLVAMPVILALLFLAITLSNRGQTAANLHSAATSLFIFIVWLWGLRNANAAIVNELRENTWDQQRMSALQPWDMTWGKLFGATAFNWYGGLICLAVAAFTGFAYEEPDTLMNLLTLVSTAVLLHAASIALNLHSSRIETRIIQRGGMGWIALFILFMLISSSHHIWSGYLINWWDMQIPHNQFLFFSSLLFAACAVFAAWRTMCNALQVRTLPWSWPLFAVILGAYLAGLISNYAVSPVHTLFTTSLFVAVVMTYTALITEPTGLVVWRRLKLLAKEKDWRGWFEQLPLWPTTLMVSFIFALLASVSAHEWQLTRYASLIFGMAPLTIALMLLRDVCIFLFFAFSPSNKRAVGAALIYLLLIDMLLPFLAHVAHQDALSYFFLPISQEGPWMENPWKGVLIMATHGVAAIGLLGWRLGKEDPLDKPAK